MTNKIEITLKALLKHFDTRESIEPGKITNGVLCPLLRKVYKSKPCFWACDRLWQANWAFSDFETPCKAVVKNLMKNTILAEIVEKGKSVPFCPY